jgi:hypothetical protein
MLPATIIRKDILLKMGLFDTDLSIAEDLDLIARVGLQGPITVCKCELVDIYRRKEEIDSLMTKSFKKGISRYRSFAKVYDNILKTRDLSRGERITIRILLSNNIRALGNVLIKAKNRLEARHCYKKSFLIFPSAKSLIKYIVTFFPDMFLNALVRKAEHILPEEKL